MWSVLIATITAELVDRFRVVVFPVVTGATDQVGSPVDIQPRFKPGDLKAAPSTENWLMEYVPTVLDGPPGITGAAS